MNVNYSEKLEVSQWEYNAMILIEIGEMISKINENNGLMLDLNRVVGLFVHITMAISRWNNKDFVIENDSKYYKENHKKFYEIVKATLDNIGKIYNLPISENEVIPILRYLL